MRATRLAHPIFLIWSPYDIWCVAHLTNLFNVHISPVACYLTILRPSTLLQNTNNRENPLTIKNASQVVHQAKQCHYTSYRARTSSSSWLYPPKTYWYFVTTVHCEILQHCKPLYQMVRNAIHPNKTYLLVQSTWTFPIGFVLGKWVGPDNTPLKLQHYDKGENIIHPGTGHEGPEEE